MDGILFLNRRCIRHPERGGAEIYTYHLAKALVDAGKKVEWFSCKYGGLKREEEIDGIKFIRKGNEFTTHLYGFMYALKKRKWLIIDEFNGIGFFTFFIKNSHLLIHQLYDSFWTAQWGIMGYPFKAVERFLLKFYKRKPVITVSSSTAEDLKKLRFKEIEIIHNGLEVNPILSIEKNSNLSLVYLGRLKKTKNPEDAIKAFFIVKDRIQEAKLFLLGDGPLLPSLKRKYASYDGLIFKGYVDNSEKWWFLKKSHFLLVPSIKEGWGQVVIQANAMGTPAIGYNVAGLRDSIINGSTGMLVKDYKEMAEIIINLWHNKEKYNKMVQKSIEWAKNFSWEKTKIEFLKYLKDKGFML